MSTPNSVRHYQARKAAFTRSRQDDDPEYVAVCQNLKAAKLEAAVEKTLAEAPPLTDAQLERIAALLRAGGAA